MRVIYHYVDGWYTACGRIYNVWRGFATQDWAKVNCKKCLQAKEKAGDHPEKGRGSHEKRPDGF